MHRGWVRAFYPIPGQKVRMKPPPDRRVTRVQLLRAETDVPLQVADGVIEFRVPRVVDYEVAAMHAA
jgi:hypothetical protein